MFLCSKYPDVANKIFTVLVREEKNENKCRDLLQFIIDKIEYYDNSKINIPLSYYVHENVVPRFSNERNKPYPLLRNSLSSLVESEKRQKKPNLHSLTVETIRECGDLMDLTYLQGLDIDVDDQEELLMLKQKIQHMKALESLSVESDVSFTGVDLVSSIHTDNLTSLSMKGPDVMKATADHIQKFTNLQQLHIDETSTNYTEESRNKIISLLRSTNSMKQVSLYLPDLDDKIIQEKLNMKVKLKVKRKTLRKDSLKKAVRGLHFTGGLYQLDLSRNNLKDEGESLGQLMARMTTLRVLDVRDCNIQAGTVQAMVETIKKKKVTSSLHSLYMESDGDNAYNNNLHTGGCYLVELVNLIPDLYTLNFQRCNLTDRDLAEMSYAVSPANSIPTLTLKGNNLYDHSEWLASLLSHTPHLQYGRGEGLASLLSHTPQLQALAVGGYAVPAPILSLCRAAAAGSLASLHVLDMSGSKLQPGSLEKLGQHLQYMNTLQVIDLGWIKGVEPDEYQHVYSNLPPSLQHLNVYNEDIDFDVYLIVEYQHHLKNLHILNVFLPELDIELLQEVLEKNNPHIHVYREGENTWTTYVKGKGAII